MTIQELKEKKQALEKEIAEKIWEFEKETKVNVVRINYKRMFTFEWDSVLPVSGVNIEVKL